MMISGFSVLFIRIFLRVVYSILSKLGKEETIALNTENYARYKEIHEQLGARLKSISGFVEQDPKQNPWILQGVTADLQKLTNLVFSYYQKLDEAINALDVTETSDLFTFVDSAELWKNRTRAYPYKL